MNKIELTKKMKFNLYMKNLSIYLVMIILLLIIYLTGKMFFNLLVMERPEGIGPLVLIAVCGINFLLLAGSLFLIIYDLSKKIFSKIK